MKVSKRQRVKKRIREKGTGRREKKASKKRTYKGKAKSKLIRKLSTHGETKFLVRNKGGRGSGIIQKNYKNFCMQSSTGGDHDFRKK